MIRILTSRTVPPFAVGRPGAAVADDRPSRALSALLALRAAASRPRPVDAMPHAYFDSLGIRPWSAARPYGT